MSTADREPTQDKLDEVRRRAGEIEQNIAKDVQEAADKAQAAAADAATRLAQKRRELDAQRQQEPNLNPDD